MTGVRVQTCLSITVCLLLCVLIAGCRIDEPGRVEMAGDSASVSFELAGHGGAAIIIPVHLNGHGPHSFVVDTGATLTCIDESLADSLGLPERIGAVGMGAGIGQSGRMRLVRVDSIQVGETRAFDLTACAISLDELQQVGLDADGLLGLNFLRSFRVTFDFERNVLHLDEP